MQQQLLGLDIGSATAKFVVLSSKVGGFATTGLHYKQRYGRNPTWFCGGWRNSAAGCSGVSRQVGVADKGGIMVRRVAVAVNGSHLVLRRLDLPPLPVVQLKQLLRWEIGRYVPYPAQETEFGSFRWNVLRSSIPFC